MEGLQTSTKNSNVQLRIGPNLDLVSESTTCRKVMWSYSHLFDSLTAPVLALTLSSIHIQDITMALVSGGTKYSFSKT